MPVTWKRLGHSRSGVQLNCARDREIIRFEMTIPVRKIEGEIQVTSTPYIYVPYLC